MLDQGSDVRCEGNASCRSCHLALSAGMELSIEAVQYALRTRSRYSGTVAAFTLTEDTPYGHSGHTRSVGRAARGVVEVVPTRFSGEIQRREGSRLCDRVSVRAKGIRRSKIPSQLAETNAQGTAS